MTNPPPYVVKSSDRVVEVWSTYQIQFSGMRRFSWQDQLVGDMRSALAGMHLEPDEALSGVYSVSEPVRCDIENRLFTNPGTSTFPRGTTSIRWERGPEMPPPPDGLAEVVGLRPRRGRRRADSSCLEVRPRRAARERSSRP